MQVRCDEGVATHIGPEPCAVAREGAGEASAGEYTGQPSSRDRKTIPGADDVTWCGRQHGWVRNREHQPGPAWSETLACTARRYRRDSGIAGRDVHAPAELD